MDPLLVDLFDPLANLKEMGAGVFALGIAWLVAEWSRRRTIADIKLGMRIRKDGSDPDD